MSATPELSRYRAESLKAPDAANLCLLLGHTLFNFGATAQRIQDSIEFLARHLGCKVDMLVSYDALLITVNDGTTFLTRIDSTRRFAGLNLLGLARVSAWLRGLARSPCSAREFEPALRAIRDAPLAHSVASQALAAGCAGAAFCVVNGGDPISWAGSFVAAAAIFALRRPLATRNFNVHLPLFAVAFAGSLLAGLLAGLTRTTTPAIALVAPVLYLVPGVPLINGGIDIVRNHVTIGLARVGFTLAVLVALCLGVGLAIHMVPSRISPPFALAGPWDIVLASFAGALAAGALACLNNAGLPLMALCALGGLTGRLVRALMSVTGVDLITASLIGVLSSTLVVGFIADRFRWPIVVASVIAALPMVPGYYAIVGMHALLSFAASSAADPTQLSVALAALSRAIFISIALVVGVIGPVIVLQRDTPRV
jgi:uncharacterized membrane protein YjjP (DUF1212 family)